MKLLNSAILEYIQYRKHYSNVLCFLIGMAWWAFKTRWESVGDKVSLGSWNKGPTWAMASGIASPSWHQE
ncbi:hypothetical protein FoTM2_017297 [Fusarium oxysporum f. sp. vasinfectum]|nr:hypothetical protein FoTM2_017297 [Fusarium oxysporum f. sp. vasinfectum]